MTVIDVDKTKWEEARLFSLSGINGAVEQENRASAVLLATIRAVPEYAREILVEFGSPTPRPDRYRTYTQTQFKLQDGRTVIPDGLIQVDGMGGKTWTCLLEFKTGRNHLEAKQLEDYLDVAKQYGYQAVITISNEIAAIKTIHPTQVDKRKLKNGATLGHLSWSEILQKALVRQNFAGVTDTDQKWILEELIRYLRDERSGASGFTDMGPNWVTVRNKVADATLRAKDLEATDIIDRFDTLMRFLAIKLTSQIGSPVTVHYTKAETDNPATHVHEQLTTLCGNGILTGTLKIPHTISPLRITADLRRERIDCTFEVQPPTDKRDTAKITWLTRQLKDTTIPVQVEAYVKRGRDGITKTLQEATLDPKVLLEPGKELARFEVTTGFKMGRRKDNTRDSSFIDSMLTAAQTSYDELGTRLKAWVKPPTQRYVKPDPSPLDEITLKEEKNNDEPKSYTN